MDQQTQRLEALGPAERIVQFLTTTTDHINHGRTGIVTSKPGSPLGVSWEYAIYKDEDGEKVVYKFEKNGKKRSRVRVGTMNGDALVVSALGSVVAEWRPAGLFKEAVVYMYRQIADVWKMDNEFSARWASWALPRDHKDLKTVLCAFMLVQNRSGEPVRDGDEVVCLDDDYREVGEAMCLGGVKIELEPKLLVRVGEILRMPEIAEINRELGFGLSARNPPMGRYPKVVMKWLRYREHNVPLLKGLADKGYKTTVMRLAQQVGYKPESQRFFEILGWSQKQGKHGGRSIAIGRKLRTADSWEGKTEREICELITEKKPDWKVITSKLPKNVGVTQAVMAAAVQAGCMSDRDLVMATPTLEELGLLKVKVIEVKWKEANDKATDQRARNIARNVKSKEAKETLEAGADKALERSMEEVSKNFRFYVVVDKSSSMGESLERAKAYLKRILGGIPLDRLHVSVFNSQGREIEIKAQKAAAVEQAFAGHTASGSTSYALGFNVLARHKPQEDEDVLVLFVGDEQDRNVRGLVHVIQASGINPVAFGLLRVVNPGWQDWGSIVRDTAVELSIPCFPIEEEMFTTDDPYVLTRMFRDLIASTPVAEPGMGRRVVPVRKTLVQEILETPLLQKPVWAA
jgi:hypothetical protein